MKKVIHLILTLIALIGVNVANAAPAAPTNPLVNGFNQFAFDIYHLVQQEDKNMVMSPYSLSSLLAILTTGAAGNTREQFIHLLNLEKTQDNNAIISALEKLDQSLVTHSETTLIANALWAAKNLTYKKPFLDLTQKNKFMHFYTLDFALNPETARKTINSWVEKNTQNYIQNLIPEGSITTQTKLVLTNAIYFKGLWQLPFKRSNTKQKPFTLLNGRTVQAAMMQQEDKFLYAENNTLQMLQLRYTKGSLAMAILLPKDKHTLQDIQNTLNPQSFSQLLNASREMKVNVSMPKFKLESLFFSLDRAMQVMGLIDAFTEKANFSNMVNGSLFISDVIQKAVITVDEEGTVAAAATGALMTATAYEPPHVFNANHPFLYIIFDTQSGILLFIGQVVNPA